MTKTLSIAAAIWAALALMAAPAAGNPPKTGMGFGIADDDHVPTLSMDINNFEKLRPQTFRFLIPWNVMTLSDKNDQLARFATRISRARSYGVQQIVVSFSQDPQGTAPSKATYKAQIRQVVDHFDADVDVWGPANEPNLGWLVASRAADFYKALREVLYTDSVDNIALDPSAKLLSPDFADRYDKQPLDSYLNSYKNAGGGFGDAVAWHPYWGVHRMDPASTKNILALTAAANKDVWITEVGAFISYPERGITQNTSLQALQISWLINYLANLSPRIQRVYHYHMRQPDKVGTPWDSGLTASNGARRSGWYLWCAASHGGDGNHGDCAVPTAGTRVGVVQGDGGAVWLKEGLPGGPWFLLGGPEFNARDVEISGEMLAIVAGDGSVWVKQVVGGPWQLLGGAEFNAKDVEIYGTRLAVIAGNGAVWLNDGLTPGGWNLLGGPEFNARDIELNGSRLAVIDGNGAIWLKEGLPSGAWILLGGPEFEGKDVELSGGRLALLHSNGSIWLKDGLPGGPWIVLGGLEFAGKDIEMTGDRVALLHGNGSIWLKDGLPGGPWIVLGGLEFAGKDIEISGGRLALIHGNGSIWLKNGLPGGPWEVLGGLEYNGRDIAIY